MMPLYFHSTFLFPQENSQRFDRSIIIRCWIIHNSRLRHDIFVWNGKKLISLLVDDFMDLIYRLSLFIITRIDV